MERLSTTVDELLLVVVCAIESEWRCEKGDKQKWFH